MLTAMSSAGTCKALAPAILVVVLIAAASSLVAQTGPAARLPAVDRVVESAIADGQTPGAVVLVGRGDRIRHLQAYGVRATEPTREALTVDTVFDLASLTKVIATTSAVMSLVEQGRIRLSDAVATHVPGFERYGKGVITVAHLLTHVSGLRPDVDLADPWTGYDAAIELARNEVPVSAPGERFVYSDINFFLLGEIVRVVSGETLDVYTRKTFFEPLGMRDTGFLPAAALLPRIAPTERCETLDQWPCRRPGATPLRGIVHDPTARRMGGPHAARWRRARRGARAGAGHRGADDLAGHATGDGRLARTGMGHRHLVLVQSRRALPDRVVRPHRLHRHQCLDRSGLRRLRGVSLQPSLPGRQG
jgi:CubicO group peptidase (beta-lactamase class C family)